MSEIKISKEVSEIKENIKKLNLVQISELIDGLKKDLNIQEQAVIQPSASPTVEKEEEKGKVSVKWVGMEKEEASIIPILGDIVNAVKELEKENINKVQAKKRAEAGERIILKDISYDEAEKFKNEMKEKGALVEIIK
jgi:ribosomal protein L7/L12